MQHLARPTSVDYKTVEALYTVGVAVSGLKEINKPFVKRTSFEWDSIKRMQNLFAKQIVDILASKDGDLIFWPESFPLVYKDYSTKLKALKEAALDQRGAAHADLQAFILKNWVKKVPV